MHKVFIDKNLKFYEPPLIMDTKEVAQIPTVDDFALDYLDKLCEDIILDRKTKTSQHKYVQYIHFGFKGMLLSKAQWMEKSN